MPEIVWNAKLYDQQHQFVSNYGADVLQWLAAKPGESILDVGCGTGQLLAQIAESGATVLGTDASPAMIEQAKIAFPNLSFQVIDATKLPFEGEFDAIFSNATFHWIENQQALTQCLYKSLKPGGRLVAEFGGKNNVQSITNAIAQAAAELEWSEKVNTNFWFFPSVSSYTTLLENYGFEVEQVWLFDRPTKLVGEDGMKKWMIQFATHAFIHLSEAQTEAILNRAIEILKPNYYINGEWIADYKRLRVKAIKK